jgi:exodeoxyribonuclease VII small subunit
VKINKLTYEETISELESILEDLEKDECTLNESIEKFKKGIELYNHCNGLLIKAEGEIKILLKDDNGNMDEVEFPMEG